MKLRAIPSAVALAAAFAFYPAHASAQSQGELCGFGGQACCFCANNHTPDAECVAAQIGDSPVFYLCHVTSSTPPIGPPSQPYCVFEWPCMSWTFVTDKGPVRIAAKMAGAKPCRRK